MNSLQNKASSQASNWATQRRDAMEKAKKLKEEKKYNINNYDRSEPENSNSKSKPTTPFYQGSSNSREDYLSSEPTYKKPATAKVGGKYGERPVSSEELTQAQVSLKLLKSKMKKTSEFDDDGLNSLDRPTGDSGRIQYEYERDVEELPVHRNKGYNPRNDDDNGKGNNSGYRKVFKPDLKSNKHIPDDDIENLSTNSHSTRSGTNRVTSAKSRDYNPENYMNDYDDYSEPKQEKKLPLRNAKNKYSNFEQEPLEQDTYSKPGYSTKSKPPINQREEPLKKPSTSVHQKKPSMNSGKFDQDNDYTVPDKGRSVPTQKAVPKNSKVSTADTYSSKPSYDENKPLSNARDLKSKLATPTSSTVKKPQNQNSNAFQSYSNENEDNRPLKPKQQQFSMQSANDDAGNLIECPHGCGRSFNEKAIEKHAKVCLDVFQKKRKAFNSAQQRALPDQELIQNEPKRKTPALNKKPTTSKPQERAIAGSAAIKWKNQSEAFRAGMRAARGETLTKSEQAAINIASQQGLVPCDYCGRSFNEKAAVKHIPFCQTKNKIDQFKKGGKSRK
jgi:hypothetical protein